VANSIEMNGKLILRCSNLLLDTLHDNLLSLVLEKNIKNENVLKFISDIDQELYGSGCIGVDINNYFLNKEDSKLFIQLITIIIEKSEISGMFSPETTTRMHAFKKALLEQLNT
jgi:hypothetical protein